MVQSREFLGSKSPYTRCQSHQKIAIEFPPLHGLLAQLVEQVTLNHRVVGSIPTQPTLAFGLSGYFQNHFKSARSFFINFISSVCELIIEIASSATLGFEDSKIMPAMSIAPS